MTTATKAIQELYQHWLSAKQSAEQKARKEGDLGLAERLASCEVFTGREVSIVEILDKLLSIQGREFLLLSGFPTLEVLRQYKHLIPDGYPVLVDAGQVELSDAPNLILVGDTTARLGYRHTQAYQLTAVHGAKAEASVRGSALLRPRHDSVSLITTECHDDAILL